MAEGRPTRGAHPSPRPAAGCSTGRMTSVPDRHAGWRKARSRPAAAARIRRHEAHQCSRLGSRPKRRLDAPRPSRYPSRSNWLDATGPRQSLVPGLTPPGAPSVRPSATAPPPGLTQRPGAYGSISPAPNRVACSGRPPSSASWAPGPAPGTRRRVTPPYTRVALPPMPMNKDAVKTDIREGDRSTIVLQVEITAQELQQRHRRGRPASRPPHPRPRLPARQGAPQYPRAEPWASTVSDPEAPDPVHDEAREHLYERTVRAVPSQESRPGHPGAAARARVDAASPRARALPYRGDAAGPAGGHASATTPAFPFDARRSTRSRTTTSTPSSTSCATSRPPWCRSRTAAPRPRTYAVISFEGRRDGEPVGWRGTPSGSRSSSARNAWSPASRPTSSACARTRSAPSR